MISFGRQRSTFQRRWGFVGGLRLPLPKRRDMVMAIRVVALVILAVLAVTTPGFLSRVSVFSLLTTTSFIGCPAVGMTFITVSGNIMSFALGATLSASAMVFLAVLPQGLTLALAAAFVFSAVLTGIQGWIIGYFRANPIIVSMAALALILGFVSYVTGGQSASIGGHEADALTGRLGPVPLPLIIFLVAAIVGQFVLSGTQFGRQIRMVGSNLRAARAAGIDTWRVVTGAYVAAGLCTALSSVMMAARYAHADMQLGAGYEYHAITAVLVGGTAIQGGEGSTLRTLFGAFVIAVCEGLILFYGFSTEMQYLAIGLIVLGVIMLHTLDGKR